MKKQLSRILALGVLATTLHGCGENDCGGNCNQVFPEVNFKIVNASDTFLPLIKSTTNLIFRGEDLINLFFAIASIIKPYFLAERCSFL